MKTSIAALSIIIFSVAPHLKASETIDWIGSYKASSSPWEVTIHKDKPPEFGYHRKGAIATSVSPSGWLPHKMWFVFLEDDFNLWAFDGVDNLLLVKITKKGGSLYDLHSLPAIPPADVLDRLPTNFREKVTTKFKKTKQDAAAIPSALAGTWTTTTPNDKSYLFVRPDGVIVVGGPIGIAGIAMFDSKDSTLTASLRDESIEKAKATFTYDHQNSTITLTKLVCYYDMHGPTGRLSQPQEEKPNTTFTNHEETLPDFVRALNIQDFQSKSEHGAQPTP